MSDMISSEMKKALDIAFRSPDTSNACLAVAKLFSKDQTGRTLDGISEKIDFDEDSTLFTLDRLVHEAEILDYYPEYSEQAPQITYKYKIKDGYVEHLSEYANPVQYA